MRYCYNLKNEEQTVDLGQRLAKKLNSGVFIALSGDLGAGKTVFVKGIAKGLNIKERVVSPTYTVMCQYFGDKMLCHFDLYRVNEDDCYDMGFEDFFFDENVVSAVEWSERLTVLPQAVLKVYIEKTGESTRKITIEDEKDILKGEP